MISTGTDVSLVKMGAAIIDRWTIKRLAWAYACAKKGSDREKVLLALLKGRLRK